MLVFVCVRLRVEQKGRTSKQARVLCLLVVNISELTQVAMGTWVPMGVIGCGITHGNRTRNYAAYVANVVRVITKCTHNNTLMRTALNVCCNVNDCP